MAPGGKLPILSSVIMKSQLSELSDQAWGVQEAVLIETTLWS